MRTTFTASPDLAEQLREISHRTNKSMSYVVNDLLRKAIWGDRVAEVRKPYKVEVFDLGLRPGIDPEKLSDYLDELEIEDYDRSRR